MRNTADGYLIDEALCATSFVRSGVRIWSGDRAQARKVNIVKCRSFLLTCVAAIGLLPSGLAAKAPSGWRDLNHNGRLDRYEDRRLSSEARAEDLVRRMTTEEKVGSLLHAMLPVAGDPSGASNEGYDLSAMEAFLRTRHITSGVTRLTSPPGVLAAQNNAVQKLAESTRLGIPFTISTDPRNHFSATVGASNVAAGFTQWPETLGFAALGDASLVRRFGEVAAREYRAVGLHMALSPQADLATEPRWSRIIGTFGSDAKLVSQLAGAYVEGFQGSTKGLRPSGVATVVKHWVGYGAEPEGFDGHNFYGRFNTLTNASFAQHVAAFDGALAARAAGVMPSYTIVQGVTIDGSPADPVGSGFSTQLVGKMLRKDRGFAGLVLSDWGIVNDCPLECSAPTAQRPQGVAAIAMPWGVEALRREQRVAKMIQVGVDQFGGLDDPAPLLKAVKDGLVPQERLDESVRRVMLIKFRMGLFDNPFVDPITAQRVVGAPKYRAVAESAQARAQVMLENKNAIMPLGSKFRKVWLYGVSADAARAAGFIVVQTPNEADVAILRLHTPSETLHPHHFFGRMQKEGRLDFRDGDAGYEALKSVTGRLPVVVGVDLDRAAVLTALRDKSDALIGIFGASDAALLAVVRGRERAEGRLPLELPRDMAAVDRQHPDVPDDSDQPLYPRGYGLGAGRQ